MMRTTHALFIRVRRVCVQMLGLLVLAALFPPVPDVFAARRDVNAIRRLAEQGDVNAQALLGALYFQGTDVPQDDRQAAYWRRRAAEQGDVESQFMMGSMYFEGRGVPLDKGQAAHWYRKAADQGMVEAHFGLCGCHFGWCLQGGAHCDEQATIRWCRSAGDHGISEGYAALGSMYERGTGVQRDLRSAKAWYRKAAALGHAEAFEALRELEGYAPAFPGR